MKVLPRFVFRFVLMALLLPAGFASLPAQAALSSRLSAQAMSSERFARAQQFVNTEVRADLAAHLEERITQVSKNAELDALVPGAVEPAMSAETQAVLLKGAFLSLKAVAPFQIDEANFDRGMGSVLQFLAKYNAFPKAITVGALARKTMSFDGIAAGGSYGIEGNFYLKNGKLMMSNYRLTGAQLGVGIASSAVEYYAALCFGSCYGGDPDGWYLGFDGSIAGGLGVDLFLEVGVDVSDYFDSLLKGSPPDFKDLYEGKAIYVGFGMETGISADISGNLYTYRQIGRDSVLANPNEKLKPQMISSQSSFLQR